MANNQSFICKVCMIDVGLNNKESHEAGKKHKLQVTIKERKAEGAKCMVYVSGYPGYAQKEDIVQVFAKFDPFNIVKFTNRYSIAKFENEETASAVIASQKKFFMYGSNILVRYYTPADANPDTKAPKREFLRTKQQDANPDTKAPKREFLRTKQQEAIIEPEAIDLSGDFENQVEAILAAIRLTRDQVESLSLLYSNLTEVFQYLWPGCTAVPFGSITTGLGIKSSDADCFIDIPETFRQRASFHSFVPKARNILSRYPWIFSEVLAIPRANTPIVKFYHIPTNTNCDVSFKTPLGSRNSALIAFLLKTDVRILQLCIVLKYWGKVHSITGSGKISNYALTMLIIFYLQQQPSPILPCVQFLQRCRSYMIDGWNTAFIDQYHLLPRITNNSSLSELVGGFFKFYGAFDFKENIVCPYLGIPIKKVYFEKLENVSDAFAIYKDNVKSETTNPLRVNADTMCIQDPFEQSRNISSCVGLKLFTEIVQTIQWAAAIYEKEVKNNVGDFLRNILLTKPTIKHVQTIPKFKVVILPYLMQKIPKEEWVERVIEAFYMIFKDILKFSITKPEAKLYERSKDKRNADKVNTGKANADTTSTDEVNADRANTEKVNADKTDTGKANTDKANTDKANTNKAGHRVQKEFFLCKASHLVWRRKELSKMYDAMNMNFMAKQVKVTKEIIKLGEGKINVSMHVLVELAFYDDSRKCHMFLRWENDEQGLFEEFGQFCIAHVAMWFKELLKSPKVEDPKSNESNQHKNEHSPKNSNVHVKKDSLTTENIQSTSTSNVKIKPETKISPFLLAFVDNTSEQSTKNCNVYVEQNSLTAEEFQSTSTTRFQIEPKTIGIDTALQSMTTSTDKAESMQVDTPSSNNDSVPKDDAASTEMKMHISSDANPTSQAILISRSELTRSLDGHNSSPENDPPTKILKKEL